MIVWRTPAALLLAATSTIAAAVANPSTTPPSYDADTPLPLVIWHGLGDTFSSDGIRAVAALASAIHPGTHVHVISLASSDDDDAASADRSATFFGNVSAQIATVCAALATHPILSAAPAVDALGFSQGGQFLRGYIERCNRPPVRSLVTFGSQHAGIAAYAACAAGDVLCAAATTLLRLGTWTGLVQARVVPAQYFRDPKDLEGYLAGSAFLADVNNEREVKEERYRRNLERLERFVMVMFGRDETVRPKESAWFAEAGRSVRESRLYREDWLGLRRLDEEGRLVFRVVDGEHMQIPERALNETMREFFGPAGKKFDKSHREERPKVYAVDESMNLEL